MTLPKSITILGRKIKIRIVTAKKLQSLTGIGSIGAFDGDNLIIYLNNELSNREMQITFFHECSHVFLNTVGLNQVISVKLAEVICESFANGIFDLVNSIKHKKQSLNGRRKI